MQAWWAVVVALSCAAAEVTPEAQRGQDWVREHPFTLMGLAWDALDGDEIAQVGLNTPMAYRPQVAQSAAGLGLPWHAIDFNTELNAATMASLRSFFFNAGMTGITFKDEIVPPQFAGVGDIAVWVRQQRDAGQIPADTLLYIGSFDARSIERYISVTYPGTTYDSYIDGIVSAIKPEALMYHWYPFRDDGPIHINDYYYNLMKFRGKAMEHGLPYFLWVQSFVQAPTSEIPITPWKRAPSESEMRMQVFTHLAAGFKGINYYTYDTINQSLVSGLLDAEGNPTAMYAYARDINREVAHLGETLKHLTSTDVRFIANSHLSPMPEGIADWAVGAGGDPHILDIEIVGAFSGGKDAIIGFFTDDDGQQYFMLTNVFHDADMTAAEAFLQFRITFDDSVSEILRLNRHTGQTELLTLTDHQLLFALPGGTGDLFKYNTGPFIPEPATGLLAAAAGVAAMLRRRNGPIGS